MKRFALSVFVAVALGLLPPLARAGTADIAYDQIGRLLVNATPPPPNSFAADAARIAALPPLPSGAPSAGMAGSQALSMLSAIPIAGIFAGIAQEAATIAYAKTVEAYGAKVTAEGAAYQNAGALQHAAFYRGWSRVETAAMHSGIISKPDEGQQIFLDLARKTYRLQQAAPARGGNVDTYVVSSAVESGDDDSARLTLQDGAKNDRLPTMIVNGTTARGYRTRATFTSAKAIGWCASGSHDLDEIEYVAGTRDPQNTGGPALSTAQIAREACQPTTAGSHNEPGRLVVFRSTALTRSVNGDIVIVTERANIHHLSLEDATLFAIPPGFREERAP